MIDKATALLWQLRTTFGISRGLSPKVINCIYTAIIRPKLCYADLFWWPKCRLISAQHKMSKIQRLALVSVADAMKTAPTAVLEALLNIEPSHIHIEAAACSAILKHYHCSLLVKANYGQARIWNHMIELSPKLEMPCYSIPPTFRSEKYFKINIPHRYEWTTNQPIPADKTTWFTGGSYDITSLVQVYSDLSF